MRQRKKRPLEKGMLYCKACKGNGLIKPYRLTPYSKVTNKCSKCLGKGQIMWIDHMLGRQPIIPFNIDHNMFRYAGIITATQRKASKKIYIK